MALILGRFVQQLSLLWPHRALLLPAVLMLWPGVLSIPTEESCSPRKLRSAASERDSGGFVEKGRRAWCVPCRDCQSAADTALPRGGTAEGSHRAWAGRLRSTRSLLAPENAVCSERKQ